MWTPPGFRCAPSWLRAFMNMQDAPREFRDRRERYIGCLAMRRMSGALDDRYVDRAIAFLFGDLDLTQGAVLVVGALHDQERHADIGEIFRNIPVAKFRVEPGVVPSVERVVDVLVPAPEFCPEFGALVSRFDLGNRSHRNI